MHAFCSVRQFCCLLMLSVPLPPHGRCPTHRFNKIAVRNWERMKTTANQAYSLTVKPLVDRLSGDQQGQ